MTNFRTQEVLSESPEVLLVALNNDLLRLTRAVTYLEDRTLYPRIMEILRRTYITQMLRNRYVVAVAGSQGAGKSTLVRSLYELEDRWLSTELGRGERVPVLILERAGLPESQGFVTDVKDDGTGLLEDPKQVDAEEWKEALFGRRPNMVMAELRVPARYLDPSDQELEMGIVLLPGYETVTSANRDWQELMRQALVASALCIVVTDQTRMANAMQMKIVEDLRSQFLEGRLPVVVVAKTEGETPGRLEELRATAAAVFDIPPAEREQRVICSGTDPSDRGWVTQLVDAVGQFGAITREARRRQLEELRDVLENGLLDVLGDVDDSMSTREVKVWESDESARRILADFDKAVDSLRRDYLKQLRRALETHRDSASRLALDDFSANEAGWRNLPNKITIRVHDKFDHGRRETREGNRIANAWTEAEQRRDGFVPVHVDLCGRLVAARLALTAPPPFQRGHLRTRLSALAFPNGEEEKTQLSPGIERDLKLLATMDRSTEGKPSPDWADSIGLLPVVALDFLRTASVLPELVRVRPDDLTESGDSWSSSASLFEVTDEWVQSNRGLLLGVGGLLGLDMADGNIDILPALAGGLNSILNTGVEGASTVGVLASRVVLGVGAVVAVGALAATTLNQVQRSDYGDRDRIRSMMSEVKAAHSAHYEAGFDDLMLEVRQLLESRLKRWYHLSDGVAHQDWLAKVLADLRSRRTELLDAIARSSPALG